MKESTHADFFENSADWADTYYFNNPEHYCAAKILTSMIRDEEIDSVLDVGCGTGTTLLNLQAEFPQLKVAGLEPADSLRNLCDQSALGSGTVVGGSAESLPFEDASFDIVSFFGVLHHVPNPELALKEAVRVARKAVFVSDHDTYSLGTPLSVTIKHLLRYTLGRRAFGFLVTRSKGKFDTSYDGIFYPFSLRDHFPLLQSLGCELEHTTTKGVGTPPLSLPTHLALTGRLKELTSDGDPVPPRA